MKNNPYRLLGIGLTIAGAIFAPVSYFIISSIPLTAIALSSVMIGFTSIALASSRPQISPEASRLILETGMENIAALLEELGLNHKAIYLPSTMREGNAWRRIKKHRLETFREIQQIDFQRVCRIPRTTRRFIDQPGRGGCGRSR